MTVTWFPPQYPSGAASIPTPITLLADTTIPSQQPPQPTVTRRTQRIHLPWLQTWSTNDNATSDGTHLPKDQLGLPNSLHNCAQSQTWHPSQFTRYMDKPTNSVPHLAVMRPFTCNPKPQIPSPPHPGATSPKCSNKLSPAHLALLHGSADHHAWDGNPPSPPPSSWTTYLAPLPLHSHTHTPYFSTPLHTTVSTQSLKRPPPTLPWKRIPRSRPLHLIPWTAHHANVSCTC